MSLEPQIKIGTSGYSYPGPPPKGWFGVFYPKTRGKRFDPLEHYSQFFDTVEINSSFYGPPTLAMAETWVQKTPADFEFAVKLWQKFTHPRKIGQGSATGEWGPATRDDIDLFRRGIQPLAESGKLAALLLQYPPSFYRSPGNTEKLSETLKSFSEYPLAVELRHRSWSDDWTKTKLFLEEHKAACVLLDEPRFQTSIRQPFEAVGGLLYFRAHGRNADKWWSHQAPWERYDYRYSREEVAEMAYKLKAVREREPRPGKTLVYFNNHARANAPVNALMLMEELGIPLKGKLPEGPPSN